MSKDFKESCNENSDEGYFLESWCSISWKITWPLQWFIFFAWKKLKTDKVEKLLNNLHDEKKYVIHISNSKEALNHELLLKVIT